jgi:hypothetical protein
MNTANDAIKRDPYLSGQKALSPHNNTVVKVLVPTVVSEGSFIYDVE